MVSPNDYIIITDSQDLGEDSVSDNEYRKEPESASRRVLESQGISILGEDENPVLTEPRDQFSRELMDEGGVEIVASDDEESFM